jgi:predicted MFS family arabinose efflux permease
LSNETAPPGSAHAMLRLDGRRQSALKSQEEMQMGAGASGHRWYVVGVAAVINMLAVGTTFGAFGLYVLPVSEEFGLSRADMNSALILFNLGAAVNAPLVGRMLDRLAPRRVMALGAVLLGASFAALGLSTSLWLSSAIIALPFSIGFLAAGVASANVLIARWFAADRGRAMALSMLGLSFGAILIAPGVGLLIEHLGWRAALMACGAVTGVVLLALSFTVRDHPPAALAAADGAATAPAKVGAIVGQPLFWLIAGAIALTLAMGQAIGITMVPLGQGLGLTIMQATSLVSVGGVAGIAGKLLLAALDTRAERTWLLTGLLAAFAVVDAALVASDTYAALLACAVGLGLTLGAVTPAYLALLADRFGPASFGTVQGLTGLIICIAGLVAVRVAGEVFDRTGGYDALFAGFLVVQLAAAGLMVATRWTGRRARKAKTTVAQAQAQAQAQPASGSTLR